MGYQYAGDVTSGNATVPRYVRDEDGSEFLDFYGQMPKPEPAPMSVAPAEMSVAPPQTEVPRVGVTTVEDPVRLPEPAPPPVEPNLVASAGYAVAPTGQLMKYQQGQAAREAANVPVSVKTTGNPGEYQDLREARVGLYDQSLAVADAEEAANRAALMARKDQLLHSAMQDSIKIADKQKDIEEIERKKQAALRPVLRLEQDAVKDKVNPNRLFNNPENGTQNRALAVISAMLGGFASGFSGRHNDVVGMINTAVDRDIEAQKEAINQKRDNAATARNQYEELIRTGLNPEQATLALGYLQKKAFLDAVEMTEANTKLGGLATATAKTKIGIGEAAFKDLAALQQSVGDEVTLKHVPGSAGRAAGFVPVSADEVGEYLKLKQAGANLESTQLGNQQTAGKLTDGGELALYWEGQPIGNAKTKQEAIELRKRLGETEHITRSIERIVQMAPEWSSYSPADRAKAKAEMTDLRLRMKGEAGYGLGVLAGPDLDLLIDALPDPNSKLDLESPAIAAIQSTGRNVTGAVNSALKGQGLAGGLQLTPSGFKPVESPEDFIRKR